MANTSKQPETIDLDAYFARIGYQGSREPTLETLNAVVLHHATTIPFENLDVLLRKEFHVKVSDSFQKIVRDGRGGYCYEQNGLLSVVLKQLGFNSTPVNARVRYLRPAGDIGPRTHLLNHIVIDGEDYIADVAFGSFTPVCALRLSPDSVQPTPHEPRRIVELSPGRYCHQILLDDWMDLYEFTLEESHPWDWESGHWFTSTHPESSLRNRLVVSMPHANGSRSTLLNRELKTRRASDGVAEVRTIADPDELLDVLAKVFSLHFPPGTRFAAPLFE